MSSFKATWLGDTDPGAQIIFMGDLRFIKGEPTTVPADHEYAEMIKGNPIFSTEGKAEAVKADEPEPADPDEGTEKGNIKARLRGMGVAVPGNPSLDTLRGKLADEMAKLD